MSVQDEAKKAAARAALEHVPESGVIGLGTGSTASFFIEGVAELVQKGRQLSAIATSEKSRAQAERLGIPLAPEDAPWDIALTVDGADEVSEQLDLVKGGGAAHTREKIVSCASRRNIIVVDDSKLSKYLGEKWAVPVEVLPFGAKTTQAALQRWGTVTLRAKDGIPVVTDSGNFVMDLKAGVIENPAALDIALHEIPGVVETGLFCGRADLVLVAGQGGVKTLSRPAPPGDA